WESVRLKKVHLFRQEKYAIEEVCEKLISVLVAEGLDVEEKKVYLAPGWESISNGEAVNTHPAVVIGAALAFHRMGAEVTVGENLLPGVSVMERLMSPIQRELLKGCARIKPCSQSDYVVVKIRNPIARKEFRIPREWFKADIAVALPKIKTNIFCDLATSSWCIVNLAEKGDRAGMMDDLFSMKMADLSRTRPPDIVIADGVVAGEGQGPLHPDPVPMGMLVIGRAVSTDAVCAHLAGLEAHYIDHLRFLAEHGIGSVDVNSIAVNAPELLKQRDFKKASWTIENFSERVCVHGGSAKFCPSGCVGIIRQALDASASVVNGMGRDVHLVVGEPVELGEFVLGEGTVLIGDCTENYKGKGAFVPGRSPEPESVELAILRSLKDGLSLYGNLRIGLLGLLGAPGSLKILTVRKQKIKDSAGATVPGSFVSRLVVSYMAARIKYFFMGIMKKWFLE
ncbi:MAG: DUF362 domain-containing protein, partial [bacterium]